MNIISNYLSFEKPMGEVLTKFLFYVGILLILWWGLRSLWHYITWFDNDWDEALWGVIKTPFIVILKLLALRVASEFVLSVLRLDKPKV
ncbi:MULTISPECIES: DUF4282 domain-containing protein [Henriciella]|mgnify:CR=1 FL=1|jgi:hypothetical protein|uniref:Uncharacterized protein n=1 Tax=Henriciella pelagia TaxID=1977912 RepID=A0ABQ1JMK5_9PROT|nr:DUF4282 domain-containing protein [Henriciella pelagia]GGB72874.1 hypothetical protein GCM10011503_21920 [Henriciella pelagia]